MSFLKPKENVESDKLRAILKYGEDTMGFSANDVMIMAHAPKMLMATGNFIQEILGKGRLDGGLQRMIGYVVSGASGCTYCSAHTSFTAVRNGIPIEKMKSIWSYQESPLFSAAEKAVLQLAHHAGMHPNASSQDDFDRLQEHYSDAEITEIVFTISLYAFLNTFNSTLQTEIEAAPLASYNDLNETR